MRESARAYLRIVSPFAAVLLLAPAGALAGAAWYFSATRTLSEDIDRAERAA